MEIEMTYVTTYNTGAARISSYDGLVARIRKSFAEWMMYRRTLSELQGLTLRELDDLGIAEADLQRIAREAVWGA
jgi:uncharacterized protein YjiS (DUF1127 family)